MPTLLQIFNLMFIIHTRDHGYPHVTVYEGKPDSWDAMAKVRLDLVEEIEVDGFSQKDMKIILQIVQKNQNDWLVVWNEIRK